MQNTLGNYIDALFLSIVLYTHSSFSLYEDQIGKFDWQQQYLGYVTRTFLGKVLDGSKQIIVLTEQNVIASLKLESGDIIWRKVVEQGMDGKIDASILKDNKLLTIYGNNSLLRIWNTASSYITNEIVLAEEKISKFFIDEDYDGIVIITEKLIVLYSYYPKWKKILDITLPQQVRTPNIEDVLIDKNSNTLNVIQKFPNSLVVISLNLLNGEYMKTTKIDLQISDIQCDKMRQTMICLIVSTPNPEHSSYAILTLQAIIQDDVFNLKHSLLPLDGMYSMPSDVSSVHFEAIDIGGTNKKHPMLFSIKDSSSLNLFRLSDAINSGQFIETVFQDKNEDTIFSLENSEHLVLGTFTKMSPMEEHGEYLLQFYRLGHGDVGSFQADEQDYKSIHIRLPLSCGRIINFRIIPGTKLSSDPGLSHDSEKDGHHYNLLVQTSDYALILLDPLGNIVWIREEALAYVRTAEMVDLPVADKQAITSEQGYLDSKSKHPFVLFNIASRIHFQALELLDECYKFLHGLQLFSDPSRFLASLVSGLKAYGEGGGRPYPSGHVTTRKLYAEYYYPESVRSPPIGPHPITLYRDEFNLRKLIVVSTECGKVFALDSQTGKIVYSFNVPHSLPFSDEHSADPLAKASYAFFLLRTSSHYPLGPRAIVVGKHEDGKGRILCFDPINGNILESLHLPYKIKQISVLPQLSPDFTRPIMLLDYQNQVHIYPSNLTDFVNAYLSRSFIYTANAEDGSVIGSKLVGKADDHDEAKSGPSAQAYVVWSLNLRTSNERISSITPKRQNEQIDSPGKVLDDRNVLYKYVNPNLVVVVTECPAEICPSEHFDIYLVDVIVGNVIHSAQHKKCRGPVYVVNSENWIFYTYYNVKQRRQEVSIIYLYQGNTLDNSTTLSSFTAPLDRAPMVEHRSFIFPYFPITALTTTFTELGLTQKKLIVALGNGKLYEFSRESLDQRFTFQKSKDERVNFYVPELPFFTQQVINYNHSLQRIRGFHVSPSGLESTSLVFAYGLDLYSTRITPSNHFDALKDDFDSWIIVAVLTALIILSIVTRSLACRKELNMAWS